MSAEMAESLAAGGQVGDYEAETKADAGQVRQDADATIPVQEATEVEGYIDGLDSRWHVIGWARSLLRDDERLKLELAEGNQTISTDRAERFRGDLLASKRGDGKYGFQLSIPASLFDGRRHNFTVRVAPPATPYVLGRLDIILPSRLPKAAGGVAGAAAAQIVEEVLGGGAAQPVNYLEIYVQNLTSALDAVAREYDFATALGLLYVHVLRRRIDAGGLQTRLTRLSKNPEQLAGVVREIVLSDEAQSRLKTPSGYHLPDLEALLAWTRLRPIV